MHANDRAVVPHAEQQAHLTAEGRRRLPPATPATGRARAAPGQLGGAEGTRPRRDGVSRLRQGGRRKRAHGPSLHLASCSGLRRLDDVPTPGTAPTAPRPPTRMRASFRRARARRLVWALRGQSLDA